MAIEIIDSEKYTIKIDAANNWLEFLIKSGVTFEVADLVQCKKIMKEKYPDTKFYVMAEGLDFFNATTEARELGASKETLENTLAIAFYSGNISIYIFGELFLKINKPAVPTKIFNNRQKALEWLGKQRLKNSASSS